MQLQRLVTALQTPQVWVLLLLGVSAGLPLFLIFSSLSIWLTEAGVQKSSVTMFSWAALAYSFKFIWAPLVDGLPVPYLSKRLGKRRAWLLLAQLAVMFSIAFMGMVDPSKHYLLSVMALAAVLLGFSSATQDIVVDAYRIECAEKSLQGLLSASYTGGYRIGLIASGAGALFLADYFGSSKELYIYEAWRNTYLIISCVMLVGIATTLCMREPEHPVINNTEHNTAEYLRIFISFVFAVGVLVLSLQFYRSQINSLIVSSVSSGIAVQGLNIAAFCLSLITVYYFLRFIFQIGFASDDFFKAGYVDPFKSFFQSYPAKTALAVIFIIGFYRASDIVLGVMANVFYTDLEFTKSEIATVAKTFGVFVTIAGGFIGGALILYMGIFKLLLISSILVMLTNVLFILLLQAGHDILMLYLVLGMDNLAAGLATTAFIAFLSSLVDVRFTAMQYSIFSSLMTLMPKLIGGYSGTIVEFVGYQTFFLFCAALCLPVIVVIYWAQRKQLIKLDD